MEGVGAQRASDKLPPPTVFICLAKAGFYWVFEGVLNGALPRSG